MAPRPRIPEGLRQGPFTLQEALAAGLTKRQLQGSSWTRLGPRTYIDRRLAEDPLARIRAAALRLPSDAIFNELTSLWMHGVDVNPCDPIDALVVHDGPISIRSGIRLGRAGVHAREWVIRRGFRVTCAERALANVAMRHPLVEAVVFADLALRAGVTDLDRLRAKAAALSGRPGVRRFRKVVELADEQAESPYETRLRVLLECAGLGRPETQTELFDREGVFVARADLFYAPSRLVIEFDGGWHRDNLVDDNRRQNRLVAAGYTVLRFTAADLHQRPRWVAEQVRNALARPRAA